MVARRRSAWRRRERESTVDDSTPLSEKKTSGGGAIGSSLDGIGSSLDVAIGSSLDGIGSSLDDDGRAAGAKYARRPNPIDSEGYDMDAEFDAAARERAWVSFASGDEDSVDGTVDSVDEDFRRYTGEGRG
jgi:hypothetical protein